MTKMRGQKTIPDSKPPVLRPDCAREPDPRDRSWQQTILDALRRWIESERAAIGAVEPTCHCGQPGTYRVRAHRGTGLTAWATRRTLWACSIEHTLATVDLLRHDQETTR